MGERGQGETAEREGLRDGKRARPRGRQRAGRGGCNLGRGGLRWVVGRWLNEGASEESRTRAAGQRAEGSVARGVREHRARQRGLLLEPLSLRLYPPPQGAGDSREGSSPRTTLLVVVGEGFGTRPTTSAARAAWSAVFAPCK